MKPLASDFRDYRSAIAAFAVLIGGALSFLWISRGTQFHQLAIGIALSSLTLAAALALVELCWWAASHAAKLFSSKRSH